MKKYGFGVDIGGTTCKIGLFETEGNLLDKWEIKTDVSDSGKNILDDIKKAIFGKINEKNISIEEVAGIGMGIPGPVLDDGTVNKCVNLGWGVFNIHEDMHKKTGFLIKAANDANVAALGEVWQGAAKKYTNSIMVTLGTGVGGGIIINNKILSGSFGAAGEIGHIKVRDDDTEKCGCGNSGCLEQYASATGIVRLAKEQLAKDNRETGLSKIANITAKDVFDFAKSGDEVSVAIVEEVGRMLGTTIANLACTVNPEIVVIGGGVSKAGDVLVDVIQKHFLRRCFHACSNTEISLAKLGNDAGIYGAAMLIMNGENECLA